MKLLILSDLHTEFGTFEVPKDIDYDIAVLAGDVAVPGSSAVDWAGRESTFGHAEAVLMVAGNHEFYGQTIQSELAAMQRMSDHRIHVLDCGERVIRGVRFFGLHFVD